MDKRSVISLVIILVVAGVVALISLRMAKWEFPSFPFKPVPKPIETKLEMEVGYSTHPNVEQAVQEAYDKMIEGLEQEPRFAILTSTVGYDQEKVLEKVNEILPDTKIYGYTSLMGIMTNTGFHIGEEVEEGQVLSLMGFDTNEMTFGVGACSLDEAPSAQQAGKIAINRAIQNAGKTKQDKPKIVLMATSPFGIGEEKVVKGIESVLGKEVIIAGGGAAAGYSDLVSGGEALFGNTKVYPKGVVVTPIYTDLKVGHAFLSGFNPTGDKGIVTEFWRAEDGLRIVEIDHQPAAKVYNQWLDGLFSDYLGTSKMFLGEAVNHTFGKKVIETGGFTNWQMIVPFHFNPDHSITVGAVAEEGTELHLLESNPQLFIKRASLAVRLARGRGKITEKEIAGVVLDQCGGTLLGLPQGVPQFNQMISKTVEAGGNAPFLGVSNLGPYGHFAGVGNRYGEVTASVIVFSKD